jgi:hypothetical protein
MTKYTSLLFKFQYKLDVVAHAHISNTKKAKAGWLQV